MCDFSNDRELTLALLNDRYDSILQLQVDYLPSLPQKGKFFSLQKWMSACMKKIYILDT